MTFPFRVAVTATLLAVLAGCTQRWIPTSLTAPPSEPTVAPTASSLVIPTSCDLPEMVSLIDSLGFPGAVDVTPPWDPAEGTDLKLAIDNGGIACAWGPPNTDAGVIVYWVPVDDTVWDEATALWEAEGAEAIDFPGVDEDAGFLRVLAMGESGNEFPVWDGNLRFGELWVHVSSGSRQNPSDGNGVILLALDLATP